MQGRPPLAPVNGTRMPLGPMHCASGSVVALWELYGFVGEALGFEMCLFWGCGET
jgi:hypothetical protein